MSRPLEDELKNDYIDDAVARLIPLFEALAPYKLTDRKKGKGRGASKIIGWEELAVEEARLLKSIYPDDRPEGEKTYGSATSQISRLKKALKKAAKTKVADHALQSPVNTITTHFGDSLSYLFREFKANSNKADRAKSATLTTSENRLTLDLGSHIQKANEILEEIASGKTARQIEWRDVSCAIALVTGRRMSEIHLSGEFLKTEDYELIFKGQLKGKKRKVDIVGKGRKEDKVDLIDVAFKIPTLVKAELICNAIDWLDQNGKRFEKGTDPARVNARWAKVLSERVKGEWFLFPDMTFHKFRGAYFAACFANAEKEGKVKSMDYEEYGFQILGDNDLDTVKRYKRFNIAENSLIRI